MSIYIIQSINALQSDTTQFHANSIVYNTVGPTVSIVMYDNNFKCIVLYCDVLHSLYCIEYSVAL